MECFDTTQNAIVTIYVNEPNPGSGDAHNGGFVGHTFLSISQGVNVSTFGFYPTEDNVLKSIDSFKENSFGFVGLSHGNESQLLTDNDVYVDAENVSHFKETLFYSTACSSAIGLGEELIKKGCHSYVGFNQESSATYEDFYSIYVECENYCLKEFLSSDKTLKQSFDNMLNFFDEKIDELLDKHDDEILVAMELNDNKDSFVLFGNEELKKTDLEK